MGMLSGGQRSEVTNPSLTGTTGWQRSDLKTGPA
jgi:hypothetical protein